MLSSCHLIQSSYTFISIKSAIIQVPLSLALCSIVYNAFPLFARGYCDNSSRKSFRLKRSTKSNNHSFIDHPPSFKIHTAAMRDKFRNKKMWKWVSNRLNDQYEFSLNFSFSGKNFLYFFMLKIEIIGKRIGSINIISRALTLAN